MNRRIAGERNERGETIRTLRTKGHRTVERRVSGQLEIMGEHSRKIGWGWWWVVEREVKR